MTSVGTTLALVHGGAHGAWCWDRVIPVLEAAGYTCVAPDLPCDDDGAGCRAYADVVLGELEDVGEPVVLVGHSLGGLTVPIVAAERPTRLMVFLAALLPEIGRSLQEQRAEVPQMMFPYSGGRAGLRARFYHRCSPEDADWALTRLREQSLTPFVETTPLAAWPDVPSAYVVCGDDRACNPDWGREVARERLGVEALELADADHSPFLSAPSRLAALLDVAVRQEALA